MAFISGLIGVFLRRSWCIETGLPTLYFPKVSPLKSLLFLLCQRSSSRDARGMWGSENCVGASVLRRIQSARLASKKSVRVYFCRGHFLKKHLRKIPQLGLTFPQPPLVPAVGPSEAAISQSVATLRWIISNVVPQWLHCLGPRRPAAACLPARPPALLQQERCGRCCGRGHYAANPKTMVDLSRIELDELTAPSLSEVPCVSCAQRTCWLPCGRPASTALQAATAGAWRNAAETQPRHGKVTQPQQPVAGRCILVWQHVVGAYVHLAVCREEGRASQPISFWTS